ncbi:hypothetical protein K7432_003914 [Basidiobolus ranarum]|uniref:PH domain-containing protein n=1 Tax=Basidiobolus ranarum TaxID=34480 RepID=A0ABR2W5N3_9FUNG
MSASLSSSFQQNPNVALQNLQQLFLSFATTVDSFNIQSPIHRWYLLATICQWYLDEGLLKEEELEESFHGMSKDMKSILKVEPCTIKPSVHIFEQAKFILEKMKVVLSSSFKLTPPSGSQGNFMYSLACTNNSPTIPCSPLQDSAIIRRRVSMNEARISRREKPTTHQAKGHHQRSSSWPNSPSINTANLPAYEISTEHLPHYTCSVHYEGFLHRKMEFNAEGDLANDRSWRKLYFMLWGTSLRIYKYKPSPFYYPDPFETLSMQKTKVGLAVDYQKRKHVFRIRIGEGQFLLQAKTRKILLEWINEIQSSINIAMPLESRRMPTFTTSPQVIHGF